MKNKNIRGRREEVKERKEGIRREKSKGANNTGVKMCLRKKRGRRNITVRVREHRRRGRRKRKEGKD